MTMPLLAQPDPPSDSRDGGDPMRRLLSGRIPALDGVRGVAILLVLLHQFDIVDPGASRLAFLWSEAVEPGWIGVQLFFVLSGFLITGILVDAKDEQAGFFRRFYSRRARRIVPLYYAMLVLILLVLPAVARLPAHEIGDRRGQIWYWLYLQNWPMPFLHDGAVGLGHTWSLAVEEQYYLLWPLAVWALDRRGLIRLCLAIAGGAFALRTGLRLHGLQPEIIYSATWGRADALALGGLCALLVRRQDWRAFGARSRARLSLLALVSLAMLAVASHDFSRKAAVTQTVGYTVLAVTFALFIGGAVTETAAGGGRLSRALSFGPLQAIGRVSYGMYLFHLPLHLLSTRWLLARYLDKDGNTPIVALGVVYLIVATAVLFGLAWLSWTFFERRFLPPSPRERSALPR